MIKKIFIFFGFILTVILGYSQNYYISSGGIVNTCSGTFYDSNAGGGGAYLANENYSMTFCSPNGEPISFNFTAFRTFNANDYLIIYDGPDFFSPIIGTYSGNLGASIGVITSTGSCLTFVFHSDGANQSTGWTATISHVNDNICNATNVSVDGSCTSIQSNICANADYTMGCSTTLNTVWYTFQLDPGMNTIDVSYQNSTLGAGGVQMMLAHGNCAAPSGDGALCGSDASIFEWANLSSAETYFLSVSTADADVGTFEICFTQSFTDVCGDLACTGTENCLTCQGDCGPCPEPPGGPYIHPVAGMQGTYVGQCMVSTCSGNYYDDGGSGSDYSNSVNSIYRTFCPDAAGNCLTAAVNFLDISYLSGAGCYDYIIVRDGPAQNSPIIWAGCGMSAISDLFSMAGGYGGGSFTSSDPSGCLTFTFVSNATNTRPGWDISLSCSPCGGGPSGTSESDCVNAVPVCADMDITSNSGGPGIVSEGCGSCVTSENYTNWFYFEITSSGVLELTVKPLGGDDYDFALYQASDCGSLGSPVRCSYAMYFAPGWTGMTSTAGDLSEDVSGDQWVSPMPVNAGESYYLMINEWDATGNGFNLDWNFLNGASLDCSILPVELLDFSAKAIDRQVLVGWTTASEKNNDYFTVLKSYNADIYKPIAKVQGVGNSNSSNSYSIVDKEPLTQVTYYRLKQTDFDGNFSYSDVVVVNPSDISETLSSLNVYNSNLTQEIFVSFNGIPGLSYNYVIYDMTGRPIKQGEIIAGGSAKGSIVIGSQEISQGIYSFVVTDNQTVIQQKLIITK